MQSDEFDLPFELYPEDTLEPDDPFFNDGGGYEEVVYCRYCRWWGVPFGSRRNGTEPQGCKWNFKAGDPGPYDYCSQGRLKEKYEEWMNG